MSLERGFTKKITALYNEGEVKMLKLLILAAFMAYGLDEMGVINADDFEIVSENAAEQTQNTEAAQKGDEPKFAKFTDRIAYKNRQK